MKPWYRATTVGALCAVSFIDASKTEAAEFKKQFAMYTAMRHLCAELVPAKEKLFLDSVYLFELVDWQRINAVKAEADFPELVSAFKEELRKPGTALNARDCEGLASGEGVMQLVSPRTGKRLEN